MNLKIEDLEKNEGRNAKKDDVSAASSNCKGAETSMSGISIESKNLIQQSMKDALIHMIENSESNDKVRKYKAGEGPPVVYEKII
mmetsp:Transcript_19889/g.30645  ORF Transcript_19889/g.30645 Transcript_19889/m.30645 type:complete len:85 (-) Transcript_19889:1391-1645(-)